MDKKYKIVSQLGDKGKEARTFLVEDKFKCMYAGKQFRKNKSEDKIIEEINHQRKCSTFLISPKIVDYNLTDKYIVMETMNKHLYQLIVENGGILSSHHQKEIVKLMQTLDSLKLFQEDPNLLNYMMKNGKIYMIDFGMVKDFSNHRLKTKKPNIEIGLLGFILKMKEIGFPPTSYSELKEYLRVEQQVLL